MNYRERMRKAIECPQFGDSAYGEYGALRLDQRKNIKRLLDEMDRADEVIKHQYFELERYKNIIDELEKWLNKNLPIREQQDLQIVIDKLKELKERNKIDE